MKRFLQRELVQSTLAWLIACYIRLLYLTTRWQIDCPPATKQVLDRGQPVVGCFWHGRMIMMRAALPRGMTIHIMISEHRDGQLISRAVANLGVLTVSASSKRGGASALRATQRLLTTGKSVAITPDGPRGPRMRAKMGAIKAAQLSGAPILPISGTVSRRRILSSWDRFCLALPFSRGLILWGEPIEVPRHATSEELESLRRLLEDRLNALTAEADRRLGQAAIEPAAVEAETGGRTKDRTDHARA